MIKPTIRLVRPAKTQISQEWGEGEGEGAGERGQQIILLSPHRP